MTGWIGGTGGIGTTGRAGRLLGLASWRLQACFSGLLAGLRTGNGFQVYLLFRFTCFSGFSCRTGGTGKIGSAGRLVSPSIWTLQACFQVLRGVFFVTPWCV